MELCACVCVWVSVVRPEHALWLLTVFDCLKIRPFCQCCTRPSSTELTAAGSSRNSRKRHHDSQSSSAILPRKFQQKLGSDTASSTFLAWLPEATSKNHRPSPPTRNTHLQNGPHSRTASRRQLQRRDDQKPVVVRRSNRWNGCKSRAKNTVLKKSREVRKSMGCWMMAFQIVVIYPHVYIYILQITHYRILQDFQVAHENLLHSFGKSRWLKRTPRVFHVFSRCPPENNL